MKKFVKIHSDRNVCVTCGLLAIDATNYESNMPDRLNVKPAWVQTRTLLKQGAHYYPSELKDWDSVKRLVKEGTITVGEESDDAGAETQECLAQKMKIQRALNNAKERQDAANKTIALKNNASKKSE